MFERLGINWACTLIGFCALLLAPSPFLFYKYGARIRAKSKFSPCLVSLQSFVCCLLFANLSPSQDLVIAKELAAEEAAAAAKGDAKV